MEEKKVLNIFEKLVNIQSELKAPKGQYNSFGKYKYRSAEDILEAVKPLCHTHGTVLTISDELVVLGTHNPIAYQQEEYDKNAKGMVTVNYITGEQRFYIKATATLHDLNGNVISNTAYAREEESKKGMDSSQITGTASSYARKYALNGLFAIDDTKDADTDEHAKQTKEVEEVKYATEEQREQIQELLGVERVTKMLEYYKIKSTKKLPYDEAVTIIQRETKK